MDLRFDEKDFLGCCGSTRFAKEMALGSPFSTLQAAISAARDIWFNKVDVSGWLEAFSAHPQIGQTRAYAPTTETSAQWSKDEQSTALATATGSSVQLRYLIRPLVEFEIAAQGQMKVTELLLAKLFSSTADVSSASDKYPTVVAKKAEGEFFVVLDWLKSQSPTKSSRTSRSCSNCFDHTPFTVKFN